MDSKGISTASALYVNARVFDDLNRGARRSFIVWHDQLRQSGDINKIGNIPKQGDFIEIRSQTVVAGKKLSPISLRVTEVTLRDYGELKTYEVNEGGLDEASPFTSRAAASNPGLFSLNSLASGQNFVFANLTEEHCRKKVLVLGVNTPGQTLEHIRQHSLRGR